MTFRERLRQLRKARRLSQQELGEVVGVHHTYLSKIESGNTTWPGPPSRRMILRLAKALNADADELLLLAGRVPDRVAELCRVRPDVAAGLAGLDAAGWDDLARWLARRGKKGG
jgi:transcriptional regulator with XRE-family HTH domain